MALISGITSIIAGNQQRKGIDNATAANERLSGESLALQRDIYNQNRDALQPWQTGGQQAFDQRNALLGLGGDQQAANDAFDTFRGSTGYNFRVGEGQDALSSRFAARGIGQSGAALKALDSYRQNMATQEFGNYMNALGQQQGIGFGAASAQAGVGQGYANNVTNINSSLANNLGNAALARGNVNAGVANNIGSAFGQGVGLGAGILSGGSSFFG